MRRAERQETHAAAAARRLGVRFALFAAMGMAGVGCSKRAEDGTSAPQASETAQPAPTKGAEDISRCRGCSSPGQPTWFFIGTYFDAACTQPVAQASPMACEVVPAAGMGSMTFTEPFGTRSAGAFAEVKILEQVVGDGPKYRRAAGGACERIDASGFKLAPLGCLGKRVCRDPNGQLSCTNCRLLGDCPDFEGARVYARFSDEAGAAPTTTAAKPAAPIVTQAAAAAPAPVAPAKPSNRDRLKQCCASLSVQAKALGASPEWGQLQQAAAQCSSMVAQVQPGGQAPELGLLRDLLTGRTVPAVCAGF